MSELDVRRMPGGDDGTSQGDESYLEINQQYDGSQGSGSIRINSGFSENSYTGTETGIVKVTPKYNLVQPTNEGWDSASDYSDF